MNFYIYRFINSAEQIVYIGKTNNIKNRIRQHFGRSGHLPKEYYKQVSLVECLELDNESDMNILELYFINKWKPIFNTSKKSSSILSIEIDESTFSWESVDRISYDPSGEIDSLKEIINECQNELKEKDTEIAKLNKKVTNLANQLENSYIDFSSLYTAPTLKEPNSKEREFTYQDVIYALNCRSDLIFTTKVFFNDSTFPNSEIFIYKKNGEITLEDPINNRLCWDSESLLSSKDRDLIIMASYFKYRALKENMVERAESAIEEFIKERNL